MCVHPRALKLPDAFGNVAYRFVRCGHCVECLREYQNNWKVRCIEESRNWKYQYFFTLTYNPASVPHKLVKKTKYLPDTITFLRFKIELKKCHLSIIYPGTCRSILTCCKRDVQLWLKRGDTQIRRLYNDKIKWFGCAEYGPHGTHRPHYHILVWSNVSQLEIDFMRQDWQKRFGFVKLDCVPFSRTDHSQVAGYISKYCNKGIFEKLPDPASDPTFRLFSKGIGLSYVERMKDFHTGKDVFKGRKKVFESSRVFSQDYINWILDNRFYSDGNVRIRLPRYWQDKILFDKYDHSPIDGTPRVGKVSKFHKKNQLQVQLSETLQARAVNLYNETLRTISAQYPTWADDEVRSWSFIREAQDLIQREKEAIKALSRYYIKHDMKTQKEF